MKDGVYYIHPHKMDLHFEHMNIGKLEEISGINWGTRQSNKGTLYVSEKPMDEEMANAYAEKLSAFLPTRVIASKAHSGSFRVAVTTKAMEEYSKQKVKKSHGLR